MEKKYVVLNYDPGQVGYERTWPIAVFDSRDEANDYCVIVHGFLSTDQSELVAEAVYLKSTGE